MSSPEELAGGPLVVDPDATRAEWVHQLDALVALVKAWVEPAGWRTRLISIVKRDSTLGKFAVPLLLMERDAVQIALNPISPFIPGADGAVDLYVVPAYDEVAGIYPESGKWSIHYIFDRSGSDRIGEAERLDLSEGNLNRVMDAMASGDD